MYPDLDDPKKTENLSGGSTTNYQATNSTTTTTTTSKPKKDNCCVRSAKIWITLIGGLNLILGVFVAASALYAKFAYAGYEHLSEILPDGGIWMIFGFGIVLALCSVVLLFATCCYTNAFFKTILVIFAIILSVVLIIEVISAAVLVWGLGVIALPKSSVADAASDRLLDIRQKTINGTFTECCELNSPPYNMLNISNAVETACLWPNSAAVVKEACGSENVLVCVCKDSVAYGSYFGLFMQSKLLWVGVVTILFALLVLFALIATCALICAGAKNKKKSGTGKKYYDNSA